MNERDRLARMFRQDPAVEAPELKLRMGSIVAVDQINMVVDLTLSDDPSVIEGASVASNYLPQVGDSVWVLVNGVDLLVVDRIGSTGPSVFSGAVSAITAGRGSINMSTTSPQDGIVYSTIGGPSVTANINRSGWFLMGFSAVLEPVTNFSGDITEGLVSMSVQISYSGPEQPYVIPADPLVSISYRGPVGSQLSVSRVHMGAGLSPGAHSFSARYAAAGSFGAMENREIWVVPL